MYRQGVRILFFYGGEPFLWQDNGLTLKDLVLEAKKMGFYLVNIVTNGTRQLDLPGADLIMVSIDGSRERHNEIRGSTFDIIIKNISEAPEANICLYMAVNKINIGEIEAVCRITRDVKNLKAAAFNFHTPYPGTEYLSLSQKEKVECFRVIERMTKEGYAVLNLKSSFPYIISKRIKTPCYQCAIRENGRQFVCGRCIEVQGLCDNCGFLFAAEYSLAFSGNIKVIYDMVKTYLKYT